MPLGTVIIGILDMHANHTTGARSPLFCVCCCQRDRPPFRADLRARPIAEDILKPQLKTMPRISSRATAHSHHWHSGHEHHPHERRQIVVIPERVADMIAPPPPPSGAPIESHRGGHSQTATEDHAAHIITSHCTQSSSASWACMPATREAPDRRYSCGSGQHDRPPPPPTRPPERTPGDSH